MEIRLSDLHYGHEATPPINARILGREEGIEAYAASIAAHGLIQALSVRKIDGKWFVADGNKRLAALRALRDQDRIPADYAVKCDEAAAEVDAQEISVAANLIREPLHEADTYTTFKDLAERGYTKEQIAARFGIEVNRVRRMLALGHLSPVILDAWRNDEFGRDAVNCVRAFTLAASPEEQERVYRKLKKSDQLYSNAILHALGAGDYAVATQLRTVGRDAYVAAGGRIIEDLFGKNHVVLDKKLLARMMEEKLSARLHALEAEGWSWVSFSDNLPSSWSWSWEKLSAKKKPTKEEEKRLAELQAIVEADEDGPEADDADDERARILEAIDARVWSDEQKAKAGAVLRVHYDGSMSITRGVVKPIGKKAKAATADAKEKPAPQISNALMHRVSIQATKAVQAAVTHQPRLGLAALLAGFLAGQHNAPIKVTTHGLGGPIDEDPVSFTAAFRRLQKMSDEDLMRVAAGIAGQAVDIQCYNAEFGPFRLHGADELAAAIEPDIMADALRQHFDPADYFGSVPKAISVEAIREAMGDEHAQSAAKLKKAELFDFAVANVPPTGWLPPELRTASYTGPGRKGA